MKATFEQSPEVQRTSYFTVKRPLVEFPPAPDDYPDQISWLRDRMVSRPTLLKLGVPAWNVFVNKKRVGGWWGTKTWDTKILPEMKAIINEYCPAN